MAVRAFWLALLLLSAAAIPARADDESDLAKQTANPISSLISVPFQLNYDCCYGPSNGDRFTLNVQPVIPFKLNSDWNMIVRTIVPIVDQAESAPGSGEHFGLGDTTQSFFLSPNSTLDGWIWGAGPVIFWPTATDEVIGNHKWGAGPTLVVLKQENGWTYGLLANHIWSFAGESSAPNISNTFLQPFVSYTWPDTTSLTLNSESTYDWERSQWTVPLNLIVAHIVRLGALPVSVQGGVRYYAASPSQTASWGLRITVSLLFPS
jgi:hypothetical protein